MLVRSVIITLVGTGLLAACGSVDTAGGGSSTPAPQVSGTSWSTTDLVGPRFLVTAIKGAGPAEGSTVTVTFAPDGTVFGPAGCNQYGGPYTLTGRAPLKVIGSELFVHLKECLGRRDGAGACVLDRT